MVKYMAKYFVGSRSGLSSNTPSRRGGTCNFFFSGSNEQSSSAWDRSINSAILREDVMNRHSVYHTSQPRARSGIIITLFLWFFFCSLNAFNLYFILNLAIMNV